jgi:hypothetical protein
MSDGSVRVRDLVIGDEVTQARESWVFLFRTSHPLFPGFCLVAWAKSAGDDHDVSLDALSPNQEVGRLLPSSRESNLRRVLLRK